jgi:hypothetical protein
MTQSQGSIEQLHLFGDCVTDAKRPKCVERELTTDRVTNTEKLKCVERELAIRRRVYTRQVQTGKVSPAKAAAEVRVMGAIVDDYCRLVAKE